MSGDYWVADSDFGRKLNKVSKILRDAGADGIIRTELTRRTQRILSGTRERDDILATLEESGSLVRRMVESGGRWTAHYLAAEFAPEEAMENARRREEEKAKLMARLERHRDQGCWGRDQGWS